MSPEGIASPAGAGPHSEMGSPRTPPLAKWQTPTPPGPAPVARFSIFDEGQGPGPSSRRTTEEGGSSSNYSSARGETYLSLSSDWTGSDDDRIELVGQENPAFSPCSMPFSHSPMLCRPFFVISYISL